MSVDNRGTAAPKREFLTTAAPLAETLSKAIAGIVIALYACGFLIVSIYHSKYGFGGTNPFRPRILAAGSWFFLLAGIPGWMAMGFRSASWRAIAKDLAGLWIACYIGSIVIGGLIFDYAPSPPLIHTRLWFWIGLFIAWTLLFTATKYSKIPDWLAVAASVVLTLLYIAQPWRRFFNGEFATSSLALWFFGVFLLTLTEFKTWNPKNLTSFAGWPKTMVAFFGALMLFAQYLYPHLKTSWGGGTPANVTVYFSKDSLLSPNKAVQARLIEESGEGFHIVRMNETNAIFVPRNSVALIYFSDKIVNSPLSEGTE